MVADRWLIRRRRGSFGRWHRIRCCRHGLASATGAGALLSVDRRLCGGQGHEGDGQGTDRIGRPVDAQPHPAPADEHDDGGRRAGQAPPDPAAPDVQPGDLGDEPPRRRGGEHMAGWVGEPGAGDQASTRRPGAGDDSLMSHSKGGRAATTTNITRATVRERRAARATPASPAASTTGVEPNREIHSATRFTPGERSSTKASVMGRSQHQQPAAVDGGQNAEQHGDGDRPGQQPRSPCSDLPQCDRRRTTQISGWDGDLRVGHGTAIWTDRTA